jgi:hypothetical protein
MKLVTVTFNTFSFYITLNLRTLTGKDQFGDFWKVEGGEIREYFGTRAVKIEL